MRLLVMQISDIHFVNGLNTVADRARHIARAVGGVEGTFDAVLMAMTGDVAFSGKTEEYAVAHAFFDDLRQQVGVVCPGIPYREVYVPGNHDCKLPPPGQSRSREVLVSAILREPPKRPNGDLSLVASCLHVQDPFFDFLHERRPDLTAEADHPAARLAYSDEFCIGSRLVRIQCFNTAWLSQLHEQQGQLLAATWIDDTKPVQPSAVTITLFHHPFNWLDANNARDFRALVERSSDVIMTGHEHVSEHFAKTTIGEAHMEYFEGAVLQESGSPESGYNVFLLDTDEETFRVVFFGWTGDHYTRRSDTGGKVFERNRTSLGHAFEPTAEFAAYLSDAGARFSHPRKDRNVSIGLGHFLV